MWNAFLLLWKNIFNYTGKSSRKEFWLGAIMNVIAMYVGVFPLAAVMLLLKALGIIPLFELVIGAYMVAFILPMVSLSVRRANDAGFKVTDKVILLGLLPGLGVIIIALYPSNSVNNGMNWFARIALLGLSIYVYGGIIATALFGVEAAAPFAYVGITTILIDMIVYTVTHKEVMKAFLEFFLGRK